MLKDDVDKDKKRAATQAAFKRKFKKNSDFWVYEKKIRLVIRKAIKQQWFYWTVIVLRKISYTPDRQFKHSHNVCIPYHPVYIFQNFKIK